MIEVIVVDDGSTDDTMTILRSYGDQISRYQKQNGGPASARNFGIKMAKGELIALIDHDDLWLKEKLEKQVQIISEDQEIGMIFSDSYIMQNGKTLKNTCFNNVKPYRGMVFNKLYLRNFVPNLTTLTRKTCFEKMGYFDQTGRMMTTDDYDMWLQIAANYKIEYVNEPLAVFRLHETNFSNRINFFCEDIITTLNENAKRYPEEASKLGSKKNRRIADLYYKIGKNYYNQFELKLALDKVICALKIHPIHFKCILLGLWIQIVILKKRIGR